MSGHERERLSAYLDGELPPDERAAVETHLLACPECTTLLEELAAVDEAAAGVPAEAPEGYFATFPARVRSRIEASNVEVRRRRLPTWTWAVAAAVLLAVVTPLTVRQLRPSAGETPPAAPVALPQARSTAARAQAENARQPELPTPQAPLARPRLAPVIAGAPAAPPAPQAARRVAKDEATAENRFASEPAAPPPVPAGAATAQGAMAADAQSPAAVGEAASPLVAGPGKGVRERLRPATEQAAAASAPAAAKAAPAVVAAEGREPEDAFRRLEEERPRSAAEWRRLHDDWNAFAAAQPDRLRADEARVRAIESAREAWLASGDESDEKVFRRDAAAYLGRADARQKRRVEALLAEPRSAP